MYNIIYIVPSLKNKGPTKQLIYLLANLNKTLFFPTIISLTDNIDDNICSELKLNNIKVIKLNQNIIKTIITPSLNKNLTATHADIIHSQGLLADWIVFRLFKKFPHIVSIRNFPYQDYPLKFGHIKGGLLAKIHLQIIKSLNNRITCSKSTAEKFYNNFGLKAETVYNGVDLFHFKPLNKEEKIKLRKQLSLSLKKKIFITCSNLILRKNIQLLIQAFNQVKKTNSVLLIIGSGSEHKNLVNLAKGNLNIIFIGAINDKTNIIEYLQASDYYISASFAEGMPNSILEALSCGLPCILSDIASHREIFNLIPNGIILFDNNNLEELISIIKKVEKAEKFLYTPLSKDTLEIIKSKFDGKQMAKSYQEKYIKVLSKNDKL